HIYINTTTKTQHYPLSLHDALPIYAVAQQSSDSGRNFCGGREADRERRAPFLSADGVDRHIALFDRLAYPARLHLELSGETGNRSEERRVGKEDRYECYP